MVSYLPQIEYTASEVFDLYSDILLVKNDEGDIYVPGQGIDQIIMYPGRGYSVFISGDDDIEFSYPLDGISRSGLVDILEAEREERIPVHYHIASTGIYHPIIITNISGPVEKGDELSAYADNELVGAVRIPSLEDPIVLSAFGAYHDFGIDLPGYEKGEVIELRLWSSSHEQELEVIADLDYSVYGMGQFSIGRAEAKLPIPDDYSLSQAYPNPFNPVTTLDFALPIDGKVSLTVYDMQGREVALLINGNMDAGYHSIVWNARSHASGMYFVTLIAGEFIKTQKLMLVK